MVRVVGRSFLFVSSDVHKCLNIKNFRKQRKDLANADQTKSIMSVLIDQKHLSHKHLNKMIYEETFISYDIGESMFCI